MTSAQIYCTLDEIIADLRLNGSEPELFSRIRAASRFIERRFGNFIPIIATKTYGVPILSGADLQVDPLLAVTSITSDGNAITDFDLYPLNKHWENGPYTRIYQDASWSDDDNVVVGPWGKYLELIDLETTGDQPTGTGDPATAGDGSKLSPGMVILMGTEQELITGYGNPTLSASLLNGAITAADEEITVDYGTDFNQGEVIRISTEDLYIRSIRGNVLVTTRGWNGTTKVLHADNSVIYVYRTFTVDRAVNGTTLAAHSAVEIYRYIAPWDVNWLCRQIAGLMHMKAKSGFAGKTGNAETGETFYFNEFPDAVKQIGRNYRIVQI